MRTECIAYRVREFFRIGWMILWRLLVAGGIVFIMSINDFNF